MTICYFTASGNCLYVARRLGGTLLSIPQLMRQDKIEIQDDAVGIVSPVYAVEMPAMVRKFIAKVHIQTDYFFFVYTYGMGYAEAFAHVKLATEDKGLKLSYINAIQMVDNYLPIFDQQEQIDTLPQKNVEEQIERLLADRCEVCYACLHNCPQNALHLKKEANTVKFRNEHVTLKDIIEANQ